MTDIEHAQWIRQFWLDKSNEIKTDLNEAVRIAYEQGRQDALELLEQIRAEIEALPRELPTDARNMVRRTRVLQIIDKYKGDKE